MVRKNVYNNFFDEKIYSLVNMDNKLLLEDYLLELKQNKKSEQTIKQYRNDCNIFFIYVYKNLGNRSILELNKKEFRNYSLYLIGECGLSNARHNRLLSSIHSLLNFAENEDEYEYSNNISKKVKGLPKELVREIFFLTDEQVLKLKNILIEREEYQKASLLMLAHDSAGRKAELCQVNKQSFYDPNKNNTNKVIGKRRKVFTLVYFSGTKECVSLWLKQRGEDDIDSLWVIGNNGNKRPATPENLYEWFMHIKDLLTKMEGKEIDINIHSMRHTCLQNLSIGSHYICRELGMNGGFPIEKLKLLANHSDISTTSNYLKDNSVDELAEMFKIKIQ
jgi:integrase/recombinase XerD